MKLFKRLFSAVRSDGIVSSQMLRVTSAVVTLGVFCSALLCAYVFGEHRSALDRAQGELVDTAEQVDRCLEQMKYTFAEISADSSMYQVTDGRIGDGDHANITETLRSCVFSRKQNEFAQYLGAAFIVPAKDCESILDSSGAFRRDIFFSTRYKNPVYTDSFWLGEMQKRITFELYPAVSFESAADSALAERMLAPAVYKMPENSNFLIVGLFDFFGVPGMTLPESESDIALFDRSGRLIAEKGDNCDFKNAYFDYGQPIEKAGRGYVLRHESALSGITYYRWISAGTLFGRMNLTALLLFIILLLLCGAVIAIARKGVLRDGREVGCIISSIADGDSYSAEDISIAELREAVDHLIERDNENAREITQKDSLLRAVMLQSRMRDIYVSVDDMESQLDISREFILIYFRVNFRDNFREVSDERGKVAFYLKQLIEMYLANAKLDATTFQVESDQIVSVVSVDEKTRRISEIMESVVSKLNNEGEYVFFTIVISEPYDDISALKRIYDHMYAISKYARPVLTETQMLRESEIKPGAGRFYFSVEQMEKLTAMLQNENPEDSVRLLDEILDYNIKKDVNGFDLYLLCTEIVNCAVKLINRLFHTTPASLRVAETYSRLDKAVALDEYREICRALIEQAVEYIRINKREEDYIISYILDYVENHYTEDIYLNLFAEKLKLTAAYISSYFKNKMNVNLSDYINSFRIKKAIAIVEDAGNPMLKNKEIAEQVGIQNINTFIRLFKKYTGYTPGEYRKKHVSE